MTNGAAVRDRGDVTGVKCVGNHCECVCVCVGHLSVYVERT